jgi:hypothetical protein
MPEGIGRGSPSRVFPVADVLVLALARFLLITLESVRKESLKLYLFNTLVVITKVVFECHANK